MKQYKSQADILYLIAMLFVIVIAIFAVDIIFNGFKTNPTSQQLFNATPQGKLALKNTTTSINYLNNAVVILFFIAAIASIVAATFADSHPIFLVPTFVVLPIEIFFAFIFHDAFFAIVQNSSFAATAATYPTILTLFQYLPIATFVIAIIVIVVTFMK